MEEKRTIIIIIIIIKTYIMKQRIINESCNIKINEKNYYSYHGLKINVENGTNIISIKNWN